MTTLNLGRVVGRDGAPGQDGEDGRGIVSILKTATQGLVDTYTITYTDGTTSTYTVTNGSSGGGGTANFNELTNRPKYNGVVMTGETDIPEVEVVTEETVAGWGFTKNTGTYSKPNGGIPASDLASGVQTSLGKAETALQSVPGEYVTETELGAYHDSTKVDKVEGKGLSTNDYTAADKNKLDGIDLSTKQDILTAGANISIENNVISSEAGSPSIIFAASDSSATTKKKAQYVCTGTNDQELINSVLSQMTSGELLFLEGTYNISAEVDLVSNVNMTGNGNPLFKLTNRAISTLSQAVTAGDTSIFVTNPENFVLNQKISIGGTGFTYDNSLGDIKTINTETGEITFYNRGTHTGTGTVGKNNNAGATVYSEPSIFMSWGATNVKIEGIVFDGNRANLTGYTSDTDFGSNCIQIVGGSKIKILNNTITECYKHGVLVGWGATDTIVMNNIISNCSTHGIDIYINTERILLSGNCMTAANIQCHNGQYVNIENNTLKNCMIAQQGKAQYNTIIGNCIEPSGRAIQLTGGVSNLLISNNTTKGGEYGIQIDGCTKITLTNNNFLNSGRAGIHLYNTTYSNISDNTLGDVNTNGSEAAIKLEQTCTRNKISNNFIRGTASKTTYGIQELAATSDYNYINNNICYNCGSGTVAKLGTNTVETGNAAL